jgi:hypothetical protein
MVDITAKIAAFVNPRQLIINKGSENGIKVGMTLGIKLVLPDIIDPDNVANILTGIYYTKGKMKVDQVYPKMSFCSLIPEVSYNMNNFITNIQTKVYPKIGESPILSENDWVIKIGDEVYIISEESTE